MSADVRQLHEHKERFAPDPQIVERCYALLEAAKRGELRGLAYVTVVHDGLTPGGEAGTGFVAGPGTLFALSHALRLLDHRWDRYCRGEPD